MAATDSLSLVFGALADPTRRAILTRLADGPATVGQVAAPLTLSAPAISQHLKTLERAGLIARTAHAQWRTLAIQNEPLDEAAAWVRKNRREWGQRLDALESHLSARKSQTTTDNPEETQR
jgi:DNA-binding transcriptional ArsR family regulator